jgi:transcriptional regulator with XRE-family HTH domain
MHSDEFYIRLDKYLGGEFANNTEAAQALGVSRDSLRAYRTGQRAPGVEFLKALYRYSVKTGHPLDLTRLVMGDEAARPPGGGVNININFQDGSTCIINQKE